MYARTMYVYFYSCVFRNESDLVFVQHQQCKESFCTIDEQILNEQGKAGQLHATVCEERETEKQSGYFFKRGKNRKSFSFLSFHFLHSYIAVLWHAAAGAGAWRALLYTKTAAVFGNQDLFAHDPIRPALYSALDQGWHVLTYMHCFCNRPSGDAAS